jgi:hypothetical protein
VGAGPASIAVDDLRALFQDTFRQLVILGAKRLRHARDPARRGAPRLRAEEIGDGRVGLRRRGDPPAHGIQLDALLGHFGDVGIGLQRLQSGIDLAETMYIEARDDGMDAEHQVALSRLQRLQSLPGRHRPLPVAGHAADVVVLLAHAVEAEVDPDLRARRLAADAFDAFDDAVAEQAVGGDRDIGGATFLIGGDDHLIEIGAQERLAASEGDVNGSASQMMEDLPPFVDGHVVVGLAPDVAGAAFGVAAEGDADDDRERIQPRPAEAAERQ